MSSEKDELKKIVLESSAKMDLIEIDFNSVSKAVKSKKQKRKNAKKRKKKNSIFEGMNWDGIFTPSEIEIITLERKDEKYASLVVELYAAIERTLKNLYFLYNPNLTNEEFREIKGLSNIKNLILFVEKELEDKIEVKNNTKLLNKIRNYIVHEEFSLKQARKECTEIKKSNKLIKKLLNEAKTYLNSIKSKS